MTRILDSSALGKVPAEAGAERLLPVFGAAAGDGRSRRLDAEVRDAVHHLGERVLAAADEQLGDALAFAVA